MENLKEFRKMKITVMQGNMTSQGTGDYWTVATFDNLDEAIKCMRNISEDIKGISKYPDGYLQTIIYDAENNEYIDNFKYYYN